MRVVEALNDACDLAYREFRERANERVEDEQASSWKDVDPESEQNPLMRPAFRRLDRSQAGALIEAMGRVRGPTGGRAVGSVADGVDARRDAGPVPRLDRLVADAPRGARRPGVGGSKRIRYRFAVHELLPPFVAAARSLTGSERTDSSGTTHEAWNS